MGRILSGLAIAAIVICFSGAWWLGYVPGTQREFIRKAKIVAASGMLDPGSTQFRRVVIAKAKQGSLRGQDFLCGEINSKNAVGAYAGYSRFIASLRPEPLAAIEPKSIYSADELTASEKQCEAGAKSKTRDLSRLLEAQSICAHVIEIMRDRQPVVAFNGIWKNSGCSAPAM